MSLVLDTSAASAVMHGVPSALARLRNERPAEVVLAAPVAGEIRFGLERLPRGSRRRRLLESEFAVLRGAVRWEDWTEDAAHEFGRQKARLDQLIHADRELDEAVESILAG